MRKIHSTSLFPNLFLIFQFIFCNLIRNRFPRRKFIFFSWRKIRKTTSLLYRGFVVVATAFLFLPHFFLYNFIPFVYLLIYLCLLEHFIALEKLYYKIRLLFFILLVLTQTPYHTSFTSSFRTGIVFMHAHKFQV